MKFLISIFICFILITASAEDSKEYIVTGSDITETKTFELENKSKFSSFTVMEVGLIILVIMDLINVWA